MGQSTNDTTLADLENQYLLQQRLIKEATNAMTRSKKNNAVWDYGRNF